MKKSLKFSLLMIVAAIGFGFLYLTNSGLLDFSKPYIQEISPEILSAGETIAFANVNLIPMDREQVLPGQTVIVQDGIITQVGPSGDIEIPADARVVDGTGKYLMPGLVDMHVHIQFDNDLLLFAANGVTSVRNMWGNTGRMLQMGFSDQLILRDQIRQGTLFGPAIYTAGPVMEGTPSFHPMVDALDSPEAAWQSVAWQKAQGYDFVKVYDNLSPEIYQAILDAAHEHDLPVVGHVPLKVGLDRVLKGGQQTIEHLSGYIEADKVAFIIPEDQLDEYARRTAEAGIWNVVTLSVYPKSKETPQGIERLKNQPGLAYISPLWEKLMLFFYEKTAEGHTYQGSDYPERIAGLNTRMFHALHKAGAGLLLGTDSWQGYHIPGFSVHEELVLLVEAGLSPYEAIEAGTRNAAAALGKLEEFGTIAPGKRADLLLLDGNPLEDVRQIQNFDGVMLRGRWLPQSDLQALLDGLAASYTPALLERVWPVVLIYLAGYGIYRLQRRS